MAVAGITGNQSVESPLFMALQNKSSLQAQDTTGSSSSSSTTDTNSMDASNLGTTFLNLLSQELQNQDPTQPMDPTAMVGQMISLNQLDQLISINQAITGAATPSATSSTTDSQAAAPIASASSAAPSAAGAPSKEDSALAGAQAAALMSALAPNAASVNTFSTNSPLNLSALNQIGGK